VQAFFLGKSWPDLAEGALAHTLILIQTWSWIGLGCVLAILGLVNEASRSTIAILLFLRALRWRTRDACMQTCEKLYIKYAVWEKKLGEVKASRSAALGKDRPLCYRLRWDSLQQPVRSFAEYSTSILADVVPVVDTKLQAMFSSSRSITDRTRTLSILPEQPEVFEASRVFYVTALRRIFRGMNVFSDTTAEYALPAPACPPRVRPRRPVSESCISGGKRI
jgi:hypothetical protein